MITEGNKIQLVKPMGMFDNVGEVCEVIKITEDGIISFKFGNGLHLGCMSYNEFEKYFKIADEETVLTKRGEWSEWKRYVFNILNVPNCFYRSNNKNIQVKTYIDNKAVRARALCHKNDKFDFEKGLKLAIARLKIKVDELKVKDMIKNIENM